MGRYGMSAEGSRMQHRSSQTVGSRPLSATKSARHIIRAAHLSPGESRQEWLTNASISSSFAGTDWLFQWAEGSELARTSGSSSAQLTARSLCMYVCGARLG
jgi:hypothetical protein